MNISRRGVLQAVATGLVVPFTVLPARLAAAAAKAAAPPPTNAFLRIAPDDTVSIVLSHAEMGQGIWTGLSMLIAEELECDWSKVRPEHAPVAAVYNHTKWHMQATGGSSTTPSEFERYRIVGATAKDMLVRAAAARWKVAPASCKVANSVISHGAKTLTFGQVAEEAMKLKPPASVRLKAPEEWKLLGTKVRRLDTPEKITGKATFGIDIAFPGLRTALIARPPAFGAKLVRFDAAPALAIPGVEKVVPVDNGVAVVAAHFWAAKLGRDALVVTWSKPEGGGVTDAALLADFAARAQKPGTIALDTGKVEPALAGAVTRYDVQYDVPFLAHAPMEPLNCAVKIEGDRCEIWTGTQFQTVNRLTVAGILGTSPDKVQIHTPFLGGAFGRRGTQTSDFVVEAVLVAKAAGVPVKVVWTREDDIRGGYYRPAFLHRVQVGVDARGMPVAWDHVLVGQSIMSVTPMFEKIGVKNGIDVCSVEGVEDSAYLEAVPAKRVSLHSPKTAVSISWLRAVGHSHTAFAMESMIDELAHAAGKDPLAYRLALLEKKPRHTAALKLAAEKAGWGKALPAGRAHGIAVHEAYGSIVAEVAEVSVERGKIRVHRVTCAVDCGTAVNPLALEAQIQGSVAYALGMTLHGKLTLVDGQVQESNFHDYRPLRMFEMPEVAVHVISSGAPVGGVGEPACAPLAPAVANAVFALTKKRLRTLPLLLVLAVLWLVGCGNGSTPNPASGGGARDTGLVAFETVRSVLQHPRCQNCHPAGDAPLQGDDSHVHQQNVLRGPEGRGVVGAECTTCHGPANPPSSYGAHIPPGNAKGWHMPAPDMKLVFVGVTPHALCEQVKDTTRNGGKDMAALRTHLDDPLVSWGWSPGFGRAPVSVPRDRFLEAWETWARAGAPCPNEG